MIIMHLSGTAYTNCGIGSFSINFHETLESLFDDKHNKLFFCDKFSLARNFPKPDVLIYHHEFSFEKAGLSRVVNEIKAKKKIAFIHSGCRRKKGDVLEIPDAYICMNQGMIETEKKIFISPCPGYHESLVDRKKLRKKLGLKVDDYIIGTFSMISPVRNTVEIGSEILKMAKKNNFNNVKILIVSPSHQSKEFNDTIGSEEARLLRFQERSEGKVIFKNMFSTCSRRLEYMQACDVIWCYSSVTGMRYASASCSDMYCSGTRLILNKCCQHFAVIDELNVVSCDGIKSMLYAIMESIEVNENTRHEPMDYLKFRSSFLGLDSFIRGLLL